ncbi:MAG: hypothetical protein AAFY84_18155 [Pseudomonadota bacterium]
MTPSLASWAAHTFLVQGESYRLGRLASRIIFEDAANDGSVSFVDCSVPTLFAANHIITETFAATGEAFLDASAQAAPRLVC